MYLAGETPMSKDEGWSRDVEGWQVGALSTVIKRRLYSYYYHGYSIGNRLSKEVELAFDCNMELFLDSGAFSAFTQNETIDIKRYADFIHQHGDIFSAIASLDDIGSTGAQSWDNLKELERLGCGVFPTFHQDDEIQYLTKMLDEGYPLIALGGLVGTGSSSKTLGEWLDHVWSKYLIHPDGTARLRVHGFGMTNFELMMRYPWASIDSSSWAQAGIFGGCVFYENKKLYKVTFSNESPEQRNFEGWHFNRLTEQQRATVDKWLVKHGVTAQQCAQHYSFRHLVNAATYQELETIGTN